MSTARITWLILRASRWFLSLGFLVYSLHIFVYRESHLNSFGQLFPTTEFTIFGLGMGAVFAGFLELMMRERAGLPRPTLGRWMPTSGSSNGS